MKSHGFTDKYPILQKIVLIQFVLLVLGVSVIYFGLNLAIETGQEERVEKQREKISHFIKPIQELWRSYHMLGLTESLSKEISNFKRQHDLHDIRVIKRSKIDDNQLGTDFLIFPEVSDGLTDTVVMAKLDVEEGQLFSNLGSELLWSFILFSLMFLGFALVSAFIIHNRIYRPLKLLNENLKSLDYSDELDIKHIPATGEIKSFIEQMQAIYIEKAKNERLAALGQIGRQVAHDIRSPLNALLVILKISDKLPDSEKNLLALAINRIESIADNLSGKSDTKKAKISQTQVEPVAVIVDEIVREKQFEFMGRQNLKITSNLHRAYDCFGKCNEADLKRAISNLINNSAESTTGSIHIDICTKIINGHIQIHIKDNGPGIEKELLPLLSGGHFISRKKEGSGLGLSHASKVTKDWGGELKIQSVENQGTEVILNILSAPTPSWFIDRIDLTQFSKIILLDDDKSQHEIWRQIIKDKILFEPYHNPKDLLNTLKYQPQDTLFLIDHNLGQGSMTGIDFIKEYCLESHSVLVTSHSHKIIARLTRDFQEIKYLPKSFVSEQVVSLNYRH